MLDAFQAKEYHNVAGTRRHTNWQVAMISKYGRDWIATAHCTRAGGNRHQSQCPDHHRLRADAGSRADPRHGQPPAGGILLIFAALFDTLDGALARHAGRVTVFGAFSTAPWIAIPGPSR